MEVKKSTEANIDNSRTSLILIGLLFISSLVLASFSYGKKLEKDSKLKAKASDVQINMQQVDKPQEDTPPPPPPPQVDAPAPIDEEIVEKENTETEPIAAVVTPPPVITAPVEEVKVEQEIIDFPDVEAQFPGGAAALQKWIVDNVNYPQTSIEMEEQGRVYLSFVVEPDGSITNVAIVKGVSADLDREAKRLVRAMPKWTAGEAGGKKARTRCQIPINFTLN